MYINRAEIDAAVSSTGRPEAQDRNDGIGISRYGRHYTSSAEATSIAELAASDAPSRSIGKPVNELARASRGQYYVPAEAIVEKPLGRLVLRRLRRMPRPSYSPGRVSALALLG